MSARRPGARRVETVTDGIGEWVEESFDLTVPMTPRDRAAFHRALLNATPERRLARLARRGRDAAADPNEAVRAHAEIIRTVVADLAHLRTVPTASRRDLTRLREGEQAWFRVLVLRALVPAAQRDAKYRQGQSARASQPRPRPRTDSLNVDKLRQDYQTRVRAGERYGAVRDLAVHYGISESTVHKHLADLKPRRQQQGSKPKKQRRA